MRYRVTPWSHGRKIGPARQYDETMPTKATAPYFKIALRMTPGRERLVQSGGFKIKRID